MLALLRRHVTDERVIEAMAAVPRERFVLPEWHDRAYDDSALPIGGGQTISQPLIVALMLDAARITPTDRVLEVGTGSGYQAAVLSVLAREVVTVERIATLRARAEVVLRELGYTNVIVMQASDVLGWPEAAPYDVIIVAAGAPHIPRPLLDQLAPGGRLVVPVGDRRGQELMRATRTAHGIEIARLGACAFVPLIGKEAWETEAPP
ncbi:MAG: protein-L-isoaspartate(D-aspartate) O-methyltransferase [Chloroflexi bacterium]|nr:protein-L-isoaspartate(D-aspartate) O-methyltransferase [Chloroflexota bacterium]